MAGTLSAVGLTILSAQIFTRTDGIALDTFFVIDALTGKLATAEQRDNFEQLLTKVLVGEDVDLHKLIARQKIGPAAVSGLQPANAFRRRSRSTTTWSDARTFHRNRNRRPHRTALRHFAHADRTGTRHFHGAHLHRERRGD